VALFSVLCVCVILYLFFCHFVDVQKHSGPENGKNPSQKTRQIK